MIAHPPADGAPGNGVRLASILAAALIHLCRTGCWRCGSCGGGRWYDGRRRRRRRRQRNGLAGCDELRTTHFACCGHYQSPYKRILKPGRRRKGQLVLVSPNPRQLGFLGLGHLPRDLASVKGIGLLSSAAPHAFHVCRSVPHPPCPLRRTQAFIRHLGVGLQYLEVNRRARCWRHQGHGWRCCPFSQRRGACRGGGRG